MKNARFFAILAICSVKTKIFKKIFKKGIDKRKNGAIIKAQRK